MQTSLLAFDFLLASLPSFSLSLPFNTHKRQVRPLPIAFQQEGLLLEESAATCPVALPGFPRERPTEVTRLYCPGVGTRPSCCNWPNSSRSSHPSEIFPLVRLY